MLRSAPPLPCRQSRAAAAQAAAGLLIGLSRRKTACEPQRTAADRLCALLNSAAAGTLDSGAVHQQCRLLTDAVAVAVMETWQVMLPHYRQTLLALTLRDLAASLCL